MISLALVIAVLAIGVAVFTYIQVAFGQSSGFTGPPGSPPTGTGLLTASGNNLGVNTATPSTTLTVNGIISAAGNLISDVATPAAGTDAVNRDYLQDYVSAQGGGGGGGSVVLYYKTVDGIVAGGAPTCPTDWTEEYSGYGPHYLGLLAYDWFNGGSGGTGGGFSDEGNPDAPPAPGSSYVMRSVAIGSDSVCSSDPFTVVNFNSIYNNGLTEDFTSMDAKACAVDPNTGETVCNRCLVCSN